MSLAILDFDMTEDYDLVTFTNDDDLIDVAFSCNHQTVSNLVRTRIQGEIDWRLFIENTFIDDAVIAQQLRYVIDSTYGVISSDFSDFRSVRDGRNINFFGICFTVDCDNVKECIVL